MPSLPTEWSALLGLVFALGLRHGIDADHIASIDALTRLRLTSAPRRARWCGAMFAIGHGLAVLAMVAVLALASHPWQPPAWLAPLGAWLSIALLAVLGLANLRAAVSAQPGQVVPLSGLRGRLLRGLLGRGHAAASLAVGMLFAASIDTLSLALMFALSGHAAGGLPQALALGTAFAAGMLVTDGANGWWLSRLLTATGRAAARASRLAALVVGCISLAVAGLGVARWASPEALADTREPGLWLVAGLLAALLLAAALRAWRHAAVRSGAGFASKTASTP